MIRVILKRRSEVLDNLMLAAAPRKGDVIVDGDKRYVVTLIEHHANRPGNPEIIVKVD